MWRAKWLQKIFTVDIGSSCLCRMGQKPFSDKESSIHYPPCIWCKPLWWSEAFCEDILRHKVTITSDHTKHPYVGRMLTFHDYQTILMGEGKETVVLCANHQIRREFFSSEGKKKKKKSSEFVQICESRSLLINCAKYQIFFTCDVRDQEVPVV